MRSEVGFEAIVVDNNSADGSLEAAQAEFTWCRFLPLDLNYGFARACNEGLNVAQGRHVMLLNPDTEVQPGALSTLVRALDEHPQWGIVGPKMITPPIPPASGGETYPSARRLPTPWDLFCETTGLGKLFPRTRLFNGYLYGDKNQSDLDEVEQIEGSALMIGSEARRAARNLDPQFFIFFEEVDWCKRVRDDGYEIHVVQDAVVVRHRSTTMSKYFVPTRVHHAESAMKYFRKHYGQRGLKRLRKWMRRALVIRALVLRLALLFKHDENLRIRLAGTKAMREVYRRGLLL